MKEKEIKRDLELTITISIDAMIRHSALRNTHMMSFYEGKATAAVEFANDLGLISSADMFTVSDMISHLYFNLLEEGSNHEI